MITPRELAPAEGDRLRYLQEVTALLWPPPAVVSVGQRHPEPAHSEFILVPHAKRPRLLVPVARAAGAAAARHYAAPGSGATRLRSCLLAGALGSGTGGAVMRDRVRVHAAPDAETVETRMQAALGRELRVSLHLGPPRANRKPVLQLLTPLGETVAFAKIGVDSLTSELVRAEHETLRHLEDAGLRRVRPPAVVHHERWQGMEILVVSALPVWHSRRRLRARQVGEAMVEIARVRGVTRGRLDGSAYWQALQRRLTGIAGDSHTIIDTALHAIARRAAAVRLDFGAWHGDWAPWNMATVHGSVLLWDWERFSDHVPLGFDALHYWVQGRVRKRRDRSRTVAERCVAEAPRLLAPFGVDAERARVTALLYLADLATRYLVDNQQETGAALGAADRWLLPALTTEVARL